MIVIAGIGSILTIPVFNHTKSEKLSRLAVKNEPTADVSDQLEFTVFLREKASAGVYIAQKNSRKHTRQTETNRIDLIMTLILTPKKPLYKKIMGITLSFLKLPNEKTKITRPSDALRKVFSKVPG